MLKVSIITACYNSEITIENTIHSVLDQDYKKIEYIIVDGQSIDKTLDIVNKFSGKISQVISEKDAGMYHALNKGIRFASGDVVAFLHADDFYSHNSVVSMVVEQFEKTNADAVYGDLQYVDKKDTTKIFRNWKSCEYEDGLFLKGWMPPHPTFFVKKHCYEKFGIFKTNLKFAADYELMLRFIYKHKIKTSYIHEVFVKMRVGGKSNVSLMNRIKANREDRLAWKMNGLKPNFLTLILKPLSKIFQFLKK